MKRIFISTNYNQLKPLLKNHIQCYSIDNIKDMNYVSIENGSIILIKDREISKDDKNKKVQIDKLPGQFIINKDSDYLLYHMETSENIKILFSHTERGRHDDSEDAKYNPVFKIVLSDSQNKAEQIIEYLFTSQKNEAKERQKTDFLYHIYNGKTPDSFSKLKEISQIEIFKELYHGFNEKPYNIQLDQQETTLEAEDQRRKLGLLRDAILAIK
jgi:hypothetical protein